MLLNYHSEQDAQLTMINKNGSLLTFLGIYLHGPDSTYVPVKTSLELNFSTRVKNDQRWESNIRHLLPISNALHIQLP